MNGLCGEFGVKDTASDTPDAISPSKWRVDPTCPEPPEGTPFDPCKVPFYASFSRYTPFPPTLSLLSYLASLAALSFLSLKRSFAKLPSSSNTFPSLQLLLFFHKTSTLQRFIHQMKSPTLTQAHPERKPWATASCGIITRGKVFEDCRKVVDAEAFFQECMAASCE